MYITFFLVVSEVLRCLSVCLALLAAFSMFILDTSTYDTSMYSRNVLWLWLVIMYFLCLLCTYLPTPDKNEGRSADTHFGSVFSRVLGAYFILHIAQQK